MAPNIPEYAVVFHALAYAGATVTTLSTSRNCADHAAAVPPIDSPSTRTLPPSPDAMSIEASDHSIRSSAVKSDTSETSPTASPLGSASPWSGALRTTTL